MSVSGVILAMILQHSTSHYYSSSANAARLMLAFEDANGTTAPIEQGDAAALADGHYLLMDWLPLALVVLRLKYASRPQYVLAKG